MKRPRTTRTYDYQFDTKNHRDMKFSGVYALYINYSYQYECIYVGASNHVADRVKPLFIGGYQKHSNFYLLAITEHIRQNPDCNKRLMGVVFLKPKEELKQFEGIIVSELKPMFNTVTHRPYLLKSNTN